MSGVVKDASSNRAAELGQKPGDPSVGRDTLDPRYGRSIPKRAAERCPCWSPAGKQCVLDAGHDGYHAHGNDQVPDTTTSWEDCYPPPGRATRNRASTECEVSIRYDTEAPELPYVVRCSIHGGLGCFMHKASAYQTVTFHLGDPLP